MSRLDLSIKDQIVIDLDVVGVGLLLAASLGSADHLGEHVTSLLILGLLIVGANLLHTSNDGISVLDGLHVLIEVRSGLGKTGLVVGALAGAEVLGVGVELVLQTLLVIADSLLELLVLVTDGIQVDGIGQDLADSGNVEAITTVITTPMGIENTLLLRFLLGAVICAIVAAVILGGITRISRIATKIVPTMVGLYFLLVFAIIIMYIDQVPGVFASIFQGAFNLDAGIGGLVGTAIIGARRAAYVNEAGVGTASLMHGASRNDNPIREGLVTMIGPSIDSGLVCTLTAIPILIAGGYTDLGEIKGLYIALNSFDTLLPGYGHYLLMVIVLFFAFSTMFSYSYYGLKCTNFLFGAHRAKYYNYFYLVMIIVAAMIPLGSVVAVMDLSFALMALPNMIAVILLAPRVKRLARQYFDNIKTKNSGKA